MTLSPGICGIDGTDEYVVGAEVGGMFMTSEILDSDNIEDLITGEMDLVDYDLSTERAKTIAAVTFVPYEKWPEIAGTKIETPGGA